MSTPSAETPVPTLTVAVPTYNGARYLAETLRSILAQDGVPFDLIVCDDRSTDETRSIVAEVAGDRARLFLNETRLGLAGNWNACVERSRTPWVAIVHQDDVLRPGHFENQARVADRDSRLGLIASATGVIDQAGRPIPSGIEAGGLGDEDLLLPPGGLVPYLDAANPLRCSAVTIRAEAHRAVGGFDPSYRYVVDWDFWLRVGRLYAVAWMGRPTVDFRWHLESETHRFKTGFGDLEETERLLATIPAGPGARRRLARAYLNRAYEAAKAGSGTLARRALGRAVRLSPAVLGRLMVDPRLAVWLLIAPRTP